MFYYSYIAVVLETVVFGLIYFFVQKQQNCFWKNFNNSGMIGCRTLSDPSLYHILKVLPISLQNIISSEWPDFGLICLVTVMLKGQSPLQLC